jgi:cyclin A
MSTGTFSNILPRRSKRVSRGEVAEDAVAEDSSMTSTKTAKLTTTGRRTRPALNDISNASHINRTAQQSVIKPLTRSQAHPRPASNHKGARRRSARAVEAEEEDSMQDDLTNESQSSEQEEEGQVQLQFESEEDMDSSEDIESKEPTHKSKAKSHAKSPLLNKPKTNEELIAAWEAAECGAQRTALTLYNDNIYNHLKVTELMNPLNPHYMGTTQTDITFHMRAILVDWMVEVAEEYNLQTQTLYLSVAYVDKFLNKIPTDRNRLQLVGISALLIAAKYWEIYPPSIEDFVYISDNTYDRDQVVRMEAAILSTLKFRLTLATPWDFKSRFITAANCDLNTALYVDYLIELALIDSLCVQFKPSIIAAAAVYLAQWNQHKAKCWSAELIKVSGFKQSELDGAIEALQKLYIKVESTPVQSNGNVNQLMRAVREKFSHSKLNSVAKLFTPRAL